MGVSQIGSLQIVDPGNLTTILFDLTDDTGANNPYGVGTVARLFRLKVPDIEAVRFAPMISAGGTTPFTRDPLVVSEWHQRAFPTDGDYDNFSSGIGVLQRLIRAGGVMKLVWPGSVKTRYIYYEPSTPPALFPDEDDAVFHATVLKDFPQGIDLQIWRQPALRGPAIDPAVNTLTNGLMLRSFTNAGRPDGWAWVSTTNITAELIDAPREAYGFTIATTSTRGLCQTVTTTVTAGNVWTFAFDAWASDGVTAKAQAVIEYRNGSGTVLATKTGALTQLAPLTTSSSTGTRISVTTDPAPALTVSIRVTIQCANAAATAVGVWLTRAQLEKAATPSLFVCGPETVTNDPAGGRTTPVWTWGDFSTPVKASLVPNSGANLVDVLLAAKSTGGVAGKYALTDLLNTSHVVQLDTPTAVGADTTANVVDANASAGHASECSYATVTTNAMRTRSDVTGQFASRAGVWDVYVRVKALGAASHQLQLKTALSASTVYKALTPVTHDTTQASSFGYVSKYLGRVRVPDGWTLAALRFEVWAKQISGSTGIRFDCLEFFAADSDQVNSRIVSPVRTLESWTGADLVVPAGFGTPSQPPRLAFLNDALATPPNAGFDLGAATVTVVFSVSFQQNGLSGSKIGEARIRDITSSTDVTHIDLKPPPGVQYFGPAPFALTFTATAGHVYQFRVVYTVTNPGGWAIWVSSITHSEQRVVVGSSSQSILSDPTLYEIHALDSAGAIAFPLNVQGRTPLVLGPCLSVVALSPDDAPLPGYNEPGHTLGRSLVASFPYTPWFFE